MKDISKFIASLIPYAEWIMLIFVVGGGLYLAIHSRLLPYRYFRHAINITRGKHDNPDDPGEVSHIQALSAAVAATVGLGNISGVAIAIYKGGPGVVFWIWMTAIIGMCIKFYSCSLAVMYREQDEKKGFLSGPMQYITLGIGNKARPLAVFFCIAGLVGFLAVFTTNQFTQTFMTVVKPNSSIAALGEANWKWIIGIGCALITSLVVFGGLKKITKVTTAIVPVMVMLYLIAVLFIMAMNIDQILPSLQLIFAEAFNFNTMVQGGFWGMVILGVRRAVFSNESGLGSAPMYHGQSKTDEPVKEGLVAMLGPFIDTIVVCTLTAVVIIISGAYLEADGNGILMTLIAFKKTLFGYGDILLMVIVSSFAISTMFTYSYYGTKCLSFLFKTDMSIGYNIFYVVTIVWAAVASVDFVLNIIDLSYALMCIPNMIAVIYLAPRITKRMRNYTNTLRQKRVRAA